MATNDILVRQARDSDLDGILLIENASFGTYDNPFQREMFVDFLKKNPEGFRVTQIGDSVVGYCYTTQARKKHVFGREYEATIYSLAVNPEFRKRAIGSALLKDSLERLSVAVPNSKIIVRLQVSVKNQEAQRLYSKFGFRRTRTLVAYYGGGKDAFEMELELLPRHTALLS